MTFAPAIRQARIRAGLKQYDLAEKIGVTKAVISLWETGKSAPTLKNWERIEHELSATFRVVAD